MTPRRLQLPTSGSVSRVLDGLFEVMLGEVPPEILLAELLLLEGSPTARFTMYDPESDATCTLYLLNRSALRSVATPHGDGVTVGLSAGDHGQLVGLLLRWYRDGTPEVDHADVQAVAGDSDVDVAFRFGHPRPALSEDEARRRLGLPKLRR